MTVCGEASGSADALNLIPTANPRLAIIDISLEGMNGVDLTRVLRTRFPTLRILVLSMHKESLYAERVLRAGANGYIMKRESGRQLVQAIRHVLSGQTYISPELNEIILNRLADSKHDPRKSPVERLSDRELEVFRLIGRGYGTRQIADELSLSMKTVESHREHIRQKFDLDSTFKLVQHAIKWVHEEEA